MKKIFGFLLVTVLVLSIFTACDNTTKEEAAESVDVASDETSEASSEDVEEVAEPIRLGFDCAGYTDIYCKLCADEAARYCEELGIELINLDAKLDASTMQSDLEMLIAEGVDGVIVQPLYGVEPALEAVLDAGIPLICETILPDESANDLDWVYVGTNEEEVGIMQGDYLIDKLPENAKVCLLLGTLGSSNTISRRAGIQQGLLDLRTDIEVLGEQTANWQTTDAMDTTEDWITAFPQIDAIISQNDQMIAGAIEALKAAGRLEDTICVGVDANSIGIAAIKAGELDFSVFQDPIAQTRIAIDTMLKMLAGEEVDKYTWTPLEPVTIDNVEEIPET